MNILDKKHDPDAFRAAIRAWLADAVPADWPVRSHADWLGFQRWWMQQMSSVGLAIPHWPAEYGGADLDLSHQVIVSDELARAGAPSLAMSMYMISFNHIPGTLFHWGSPEQKQRYLRGVSRGDIWCQGFSEPGAGSDLASLTTRAVREGDHYVVNGHKIWSSYSMFARYCILLARTDTTVRKQAGITYFIMDMAAPGVEVRPIRQSTGESEFAELFLTDVRIPVADRVGEEGQGWQVAQATLAAERGILSFEHGERMRYAMERFHADALRKGHAWTSDPVRRRQFVSLLGRLQALRRLIRTLLRENQQAVPAMTSAYVKILATELRQSFAEFQTDVGGIDEQVEPARSGQGSLNFDVAMFDYLESFGYTIAAGSNEIMRNLIAERGLGMPR